MLFAGALFSSGPLPVFYFYLFRIPQFSVTVGNKYFTYMMIEKGSCRLPGVLFPEFHLGVNILRCFYSLFCAFFHRMTGMNTAINS